jgi:hypothetical protein
MSLFLHFFVAAGIAIANFGLNKEVWYTSNSKSGKGKIVPVQAMGKGGLAPLILNLNVGISGQFQKLVALRDTPASIQFLAVWIPRAVCISNTNAIVALYHKLDSCKCFQLLAI